MSHYYITTPIYYVNDVPHIGHAYTSIAADVIARFMRLDGMQVKFLTGTDEHGKKVETSASKLGLDAQSFTDKLSVSFREMSDYLNLTNDDFIRTTEYRHKKAAIALWQKLEENGYIYLSKYAGWYSVRDEAFYAESEISEDKLAPTGAPVEWIEEPSYFFALSKFQDKLLKFYEENPHFIKPESRRNEVISFVKGGLHDLSISRTSFKWGVEVPSSPGHIMYVWLDALTNYISALGYPDLDHQDFQTYWPANLHIMGKDIIRFHAVYWPAFLMAADLPLPQKLFAHGWWTNEGQKMSKSIGNVISPKALIEEFGSDQVRYFLMREMIFGNDGNYSREAMIIRINSELANNIGNLAQRILSFVQKNLDGIVPAEVDHALFIKAQNLHKQFRTNMHNQEINAVLDGIISFSSDLNVFVDQQAPWNLKNTDISKMKEILYICMECLRYIGIYLLPFTPDAANKLLDLLEINLEHRNFANIMVKLAEGTKLPSPSPIFPRFMS